MNPSDMQLPDFTQMLKGLSLPGVDVNALVASRRKDIEALVAANQRAQDGFKALVQRQTEILQEVMRKAQPGTQGGGNLGQSLTDAATRQAETAKQAFEQALGNMRELAEMATASQTQAFEVIQKRVKESVEETRQLLQPKSS